MEKLILRDLLIPQHDSEEVRKLKDFFRFCFASGKGCTLKRGKQEAWALWGINSVHAELIVRRVQQYFC